MDRTEQTVRHMLAGIQAPRYDVGVLSSRGMLPGLDAIPGEEVLDNFRLLKFRNARGSHIYLRPSGEHRYTVLDDFDGAKLARLSADGFEPCAVVETSQGNFQAWLKQAAVLPKLLGTYVAQTLAPDMVPTRARPTGDASAGYLASPTAKPSTNDLTGCSLSFGCKATPDSSSQKLRPSSKRSPSLMETGSVSASNDARKGFFLPRKARGLFPRLSASVPPPSTPTGPPRQT